ncbi:Conidial hydrophobin Hyp1 RodA [Aspergillus sp. HF37]|nr:Conidial hydrophobin Hyp1 RodA [Aspergillus sp. HF37]
MKFSLAAITLAFAATVAAAPQSGKHGNKFLVSDDVDVEQKVNKCATNAKVRCCNDQEINTGDSQNVKKGLLAGGLLGGLLPSNGANSDSVKLFDQCSDLGVGVGVLGAGASQLLNSKCEQNIACCQDTKFKQNGVVNVGLGCVGLGSII